MVVDILIKPFNENIFKNGESCVDFFMMDEDTTKKPNSRI